MTLTQKGQKNQAEKTMLLALRLQLDKYSFNKRYALLPEISVFATGEMKYLGISNIKNIALQLLSSVGTALAWASRKTTQLVMDALPAVRPDWIKNQKVQLQELALPYYLCRNQ